MNMHLEKLFTDRRRCYFIPLDGYIKGHGWRPSIVFEGEDGHYPVGDWPYEGKAGQRMPYFWGHDYKKAVKTADEMNEKMGISKAMSISIVTSSIVVSKESRRGRRRT